VIVLLKNNLLGGIIIKTPDLETERMILRPLSLSDAEQIFNCWTTDEDVARYMVWDIHENVEDTIEWLKLEEANLLSNKNYTWGMVLKENNELFGTIGLNYKDEEKCFSLGYNIAKKYWRNDLTTEAGRKVLEFGVKDLGQKKFFCRHAVENIGSMKVMTKLGFKYAKDGEYSSFSGKKHFKSKDYYLIINK